MNPRTILTLCWYESQQRLVTAKVFKVVTSASSLPLGIRLSQCDGKSNSWSFIQPQTLEKPKTCQESTMCQPVISALQIPGNLLFPCWRKGLKRAIPGGPTAAHAPNGSPSITSCILVPFPQQQAWPSPCVSRSLEMHSKKTVFPRA